MDAPVTAGQFDGEFQTGTVEWFNRERGFGFIIADVSGVKLFADKLFTLPKRTLLHEGQRVRFRVHTFRRGGPQAVDIVPANDSAD